MKALFIHLKNGNIVKYPDESIDKIECRELWRDGDCEVWSKVKEVPPDSTPTSIWSFKKPLKDYAVK